jgi:hypothetical protein
MSRHSGAARISVLAVAVAIACSLLLFVFAVILTLNAVNGKDPETARTRTTARIFLPQNSRLCSYLLIPRTQFAEGRST